jgi:hypothetical protein
MCPVLHSREMEEKIPSHRRSRGQAAIEYLMTTVALTVFFAGLYGFLQGQVRRLFVLAGTKILTSYR